MSRQLVRWAYTRLDDGDSIEGTLSLRDNGKIVDRPLRRNGGKVEVHGHVILSMRGKPEHYIERAQVWLARKGYQIST